MIEIHRYTTAYHRDWNDFVSESSNSTFLFLREYMEYHADRFTDYSLLVYDGNKLLALLPANRSGDVLYSHAGLTYGGLIVTTRNTTAQVLEIMRSIADFLKKERFVKWVYKCIPHIYHRYPSESDLYALFRLEARLIGRNISSTVQLDNSLRLRADRRSRMKKAEQAGLRVVETTEFSPFWKVLDANLQERFHVKPVHSLDEIVLLHSRFSDRIRHFVTMRGDEILAGSVIYDTGIVAHAQYTSASAEGKASGALDLLYARLIGEVFADRKWFDFGQSTEDMGRYLNEGLIAQKEGFGGRGVAYDIYEITL